MLAIKKLSPLFFRKTLMTSTGLALALAAMSPVQATVFDVTITVDNAYAFGFGDENGIAAGNLYGGVINGSACEIFCGSGPEHYTVNSNQYQYVYASVWADDATAQGFLANFSSDGLLLDSQSAWQVFATGNKTNRATSVFQLNNINDAINDANNGQGAANGSIGWVDQNGANSTNGKLMVDLNNTLYDSKSPQAGGLAGKFSDSDHWMWYDNGQTSNPFKYSDAGDAGWLVFRADLGAIKVPEPASIALVGIGVFGLAVSRRRKNKSTLTA